MENTTAEKRYVVTYLDRKQAVFFTVDGMLQAVKDAIRWRPDTAIVSVEQKEFDNSFYENYEGH